MAVATANFEDQFEKDQDVYITGRRGSPGPYKVDEVLGCGTYKLREQNGEKINGIFDEGNLSRLPKII
ncbi:MAG: hypothetical protein Q9225_007102 [Loekoesia sp. 1 TL-2023]